MRATTLPVPIPSASDALLISPLTDLHLGIKPAATAQLLADTDYLRRMEHIVLLGDQAAAWGTDEEYVAVNDFIAKLARPYSAVTGNHEFFFEVVPVESVAAGRVFKEASPLFKTDRLNKFQSFYNYENLWQVQPTELGVFLHLCLDDVDHHRPEALSLAQQAFLEIQLREYHDRPVFIFCHAPLSLGQRLDMTYYEETRTACVELKASLLMLCTSREAPLLWISGHIHLRPDHYLYPAYQLAPQVWQVHCPDSIGYSRWTREQVKPEMHDGLYSRYLEIRPHQVSLVTRDHVAQRDIMDQVIQL